MLELEVLVTGMGDECNGREWIDILRSIPRRILQPRHAPLPAARAVHWRAPHSQIGNRNGGLEVGAPASLLHGLHRLLLVLLLWRGHPIASLLVHLGLPWVLLVGHVGLLDVGAWSLGRRHGRGTLAAAVSVSLGDLGGEK